MEGIDASADCVRPTQDLAIRGLDGTKREHCLEGVLDVHEDSCAFNLLVGYSRDRGWNSEAMLLGLRV